MMSLAVSSPTGPRTSNYGTPTTQPSPPAPPKEDVTVKVALNQIVEVVIPFNTPRARAIRSHLLTHLLTPDGQRAIVFRMLPVPAWTNIHQNSSASNPIITMEPVAFCDKLLEIVPSCEHIGQVKFTDEHGTPTTMEAIKNFQFIPLEVTGQSSVTRIVMPDKVVQDTEAGARVTLDAVFDIKLCEVLKTVEETSRTVKKLSYVSLEHAYDN